MNNNDTLAQLPKYRCHKEVWALKIKAIHAGHDDTPMLEFEDSGYAPRPVTFAWLYKHTPQAGGYWVQYKDGYESYSPAKEFEEGYTRV